MSGIKQKISFEERRRIGYEYYISQGLSPIQASALIGNFIQESNLDPLAKGDNGSASGLAQWRLDRLQRLRDINGFDNSENYGNQLNFALQELQTTHKKAFERLKKAQTIEEATLAISEDFERPNKKYASNDKRIQYALDTHNKYNTPITLQQQETPIGNIYQTQVAPYINQMQNVSNLPTTTILPILAEEDKIEEEQDTEVEKAKETLILNQQQEQREQQFLQDILKASQVEYIDPNQSTDYTQQEQFQNGGTKKPIYVESKNDPRYQAYNDSLSLYNYTKLQRALEKPKSTLENMAMDFGLNNGKEERIKNQLILEKEAKRIANTSKSIKFGTFANPVSEDYLKQGYEERGSWDIYNPNIKPKGNWKGLAQNNDYSNVKPTQPVILQDLLVKPPQPIPPKSPIPPPTKKTPQVTALKQLLPPQDITRYNSEITAPLSRINIPARIPQYYEVTDKVNQNFGGTETNYKWYPENGNLQQQSEEFYDDGTPYNSRKLVPVYQSGGNIIRDDNGYWNPQNWGTPVEINSNLITMQGVDQPLWGVSNQTGEKKLMLPGVKEYRFKNTQQVTEYPLKNKRFR